MAVVGLIGENGMRFLPSRDSLKLNWLIAARRRTESYRNRVRSHGSRTYPHGFAVFYVCRTIRPGPVDAKTTSWKFSCHRRRRPTFPRHHGHRKTYRLAQRHAVSASQERGWGTASASKNNLFANDLLYIVIIIIIIMLPVHACIPLKVMSKYCTRPFRYDWFVFVRPTTGTDTGFYYRLSVTRLILNPFELFFRKYPFLKRGYGRRLEQQITRQNPQWMWTGIPFSPRQGMA